GTTNEYLLKPVLHAVNVAETGSISGIVEPTDFQTYVMAVSGEDTLSSYTEDNGEFMIQTLAPGSYDVTFQPEDDQYRESTQTGIEVMTGEETDLGTITLTQ
ncbi:MAG: carboxypeptidase regulatory-like domain-containing protein, partial [Balneolaceae bacterium]|nr:carboxypeptidase regulatory-like domain-containing protein [Balneolaceae bacterium]